MVSRSKGFFAALFVAFSLCILPAMAMAQSTYDYAVYVDADANSGSGCTVGPVSGAEVRLHVSVTGGLSPHVDQVTRALCAGGSFSAEVAIGGGYAVGTNNGVAGSDVIELSDALNQLTRPGAPSVMFSVVATSATGEDFLLSADGSGGGPPIGLALAATPIPLLGIPALILMALLIAMVGARVARRRGLLRVAAMVFLFSGVVLAANFVVDGQVGDWSGVSPIANDPAGDATSGESAIDLRAFFAAIENNRVFMRIDVSNLQNNAPTAVAGSASTLEDQSVTVALTGTDNENDTLSFAIVNAPTSGSLGAITPTGPQSATVQYTPNADTNGSDSFTFTVNDGQSASAASTIALAITAVNDVPSFTGGADQVVNEDAAAQSVTGWATGISAGPADESAQALDFIVGNDNNTLFSAQPSISAAGVLSYTPAANANGVATVTVSLHDDGGTANGGVDTSAAQTFTITVNSVNDAPSFTKGADQTVLEGAAAQSINPWATAISAGPANESAQVLTFTVGNDNNALFSAQPSVSATGVLTYTAAVGANGSAIVTLSLSDDGGTANGGIDTSASQTFTITVTGINDAPSFTAGANQTVLEDAGAQSVNPWATAISAGPPNESTQVVSFNVTGNTNAALFSAAPAISSAGVLTYTPAANVNGTATITLVAMDDGGTANGGVDTSAAQTFTITVTAVNDAPSFVKGADQTVLENAAAQNIAGWATAISPGPADESGQTPTFAVTGNTNAGLFSVAPSVSAAGALSFTTVPNTNGTATISLRLSDNGGTANGGQDTSAVQTFVINVTAVNNAPSFDVGADQIVAEDAGAQTVNPWATAISAGPVDEAGQTLTFNITGNTNAALFSAAPAVSSTGVLTYTPAADASGTATITLSLSDNGGTANGGVDTSATQIFDINVAGVNDPPVLDLNGPAAGSGFAATYTEATPAVAIVDPAALTVVDIDSANMASATVTISNLLDGALESLSANTGATSIVASYVNGTGILTLAGSDTVANYQAVLRTVKYLNTSTAPNETARVVNFVANDGSINSNIAISTVTVVGVNTVPSFTAGPVVTINEDAGAQTIASWATAINDNDGGLQTVSFAVTPNSGSLTFSTAPAISPTGTLTFTAAANASGTASFNVVLTDNGSNNNTSAAQTLTITVNGVNDAPSFTKGADQSVLEDAGAQSVSAWASSISPGPADESAQALTFNITGNTNPTLFSAAPIVAANGTLTYTPVANANGTATISLTLSDNGGTANGGVDTSGVQTFVITVNAVNDAPNFLKGADQAALDNAGALSVNPWATAISAGPANESGQTVGFVIDSNSAPTAFAAGPTISATGVLTYTPAIVPAGTTTATIVLHALDNGGTANGGIDASATQSFVIAITHANDPPVLTNNPITYATVGNTQLHVAGATIPGLVAISDAQSALTKSVPTDTDGPLTPSVVPASGTSTNGGNFSIDATGAFTYVPQANYTGTDSFTYTVTDGNTPTPGTVIGTINITVGPKVWYIDNQTGPNNPAAGSDGRSNNAFETLATAQAASGNGDILFVFNGDSATTPLTVGIVLKNGQRLWGEGYGLAVPPFGTMVPAGTQPRINAGASDAVSVPATTGDRTGVEVRGLDLQGNNGVDVTATGANNVAVIIAGNTVRGSVAEGLDVNFGSTGTQQIAIDNNTITSGGTGIHVNRTVGTATITGFINNTISANNVGSGIIVSGAIFDSAPGGSINQVNGGTTAIGVSGNGTGANGMVLLNVIGDLSFTDLDIYNDSGTGLLASSTGALNAGAGTGFRISVNAGVATFRSIAGPAVDISGASISLPLQDVQSTNSTTTGISLLNAFGGVSSTAFSAASGLISDPVAASGTAFRVDGGNGNVTFPGSITSNSGNAVVVANRTSDTVSLSGAITETGSGISLTSNTGATIAFSGALSLNTGANPAFTATGGGTVTTTNTTSTAVTTTGTAINVANTTIGAGNLIFRSVSAGTGASGPVNGIALNNTGALGGLKVNGTGSAGSGGTIQRASGNGIALINSRNVSLTYMNVQNNLGSGIRAEALNGMAFANLSVINNSDSASNCAIASLPACEAGIFVLNLTGSSNSISNSTVSGSFEDNIHFENRGTNNLGAVTVSGNTITDNSTASGNIGLAFLSADTAIVNATATNNTFHGNRTVSLRADAADGSAMNATFTSNKIFAGAPNQGNQGIEVSGANGSDLIFNLTGNVIGKNGASDAPLMNTGINVFFGSATTGLGPTVIGNVTNNTVFNAGTGFSGFGIRAFAAGGDAVWRVRVDGNTVSNVGLDYGLFVGSGEQAGSTTNMQVGVYNNSVTVLAPALDAIRVQSRNTALQCARVNGNTGTQLGGGCGGAGFCGILVRQANTSTFNLESGVAGLASGNPGTLAAGIGSFGTVTNVAANTCNQIP